MAKSIKVKSNTRRVRKFVTKLTDDALGEAMQDARKLAGSMMDDQFKNDTGKLKASLRVIKKKEMEYALQTTAVNVLGKGYGAKQEWGYHDRGGKWIRGKHIVQRATFGMIRRHEKGGKFEDKLPIPSELKIKL